MISVRHIAALAALACLALVAGCGDSESSAPSKAAYSAPSKAAYIKQANQICKKAYEQRSAGVDETIEAIVKDGKQLPPAVEQKQIALEAVVPVGRTMVEELSDLPMPEGDERQLETLMEHYGEGLAAYEADPTSAFETPTNEAAKANELARAYGLSDEFCSI